MRRTGENSLLGRSEVQEPQTRGKASMQQGLPSAPRSIPGSRAIRRADQCNDRKGHPVHRSIAIHLQASEERKLRSKSRSPLVRQSATRVCTSMVGIPRGRLRCKPHTRVRKGAWQKPRTGQLPPLCAGQECIPGWGNSAPRPTFTASAPVLRKTLPPKHRFRRVGAIKYRETFVPSSPCESCTFA